MFQRASGNRNNYDYIRTRSMATLGPQNGVTRDDSRASYCGGKNSRCRKAGYIWRVR
jgi:hypothetical protein